MTSHTFTLVWGTDMVARFKNVALSIAAVLACSSVASAGSITYATPTGSSTGGGPVSAVADFTTGTNTLTVQMQNLQANPTDVAQLISDLFFTLSGFTTSTCVGCSLSSSSADHIDI